MKVCGASANLTSKFHVSAKVLLLILVRVCPAVTTFMTTSVKIRNTNLSTGLKIEMVHCIGSMVISQAYILGVLYELKYQSAVWKPCPAARQPVT